MPNENQIDRSDAFRMEMAGIRFVSPEEAAAILAANEAEDAERRARRARRHAASEAAAKAAAGGR